MFYFNLNHRFAAFLKSFLVIFYRCIGRKTVSFDVSNKILQNFVRFQKSHEPIQLMAIQSINGGKSNYYQNDKLIPFNPQFIWEVNLNDKIKSIHISRSGAVMLNNKWILNLDFGGNAGLLNAPFSKVFEIEKPVIAPWSHFWGRYYDFVITLLPKLCKIEESMGKDIWSKVMVCYPMFNASYESEFLEKLGIPKTALMDTRKNKSFVKAKSVIFSNNNNMYFPFPTDIKILRDRFLIKNGYPGNKRIFISRKGRRKIINEDEVINVLREFDFEVLEDLPRSINDQMEIFYNASVIVGTHGAAFTNLVWCNPGTKVLELFNSGYTPPFYYFLSQLLRLEYHFMMDNSSLMEHKNHVARDLLINTKVLKNGLLKMLH